MIIFSLSKNRFYWSTESFETIHDEAEVPMSEGVNYFFIIRLFSISEYPERKRFISTKE